MKRLVLFTLIFLLIFAGCEQDNQDLTIVKENSVDKENDFLMIPNPEGDGDLEDFDLETIFEGANDDDEVNFLDIVCPEPTPEPIDYESISKDDYRIRSVIEALKMTKQSLWRDEFIEEYEAEICFNYNDLFWLSGNGASFDILSNSKFADDLFEKYGVTVEQYYSPEEEHISYFILVGEFDGEPYLFSLGYLMGNKKITWSAVDSNQKSNAMEVANLYAQMDGLNLQIKELGDMKIYYYTGNGDTFLIDLIGNQELSTVYFWDKENTLCIIIIPGEHYEENFNYCIFEKHEY